MKIPKIYKVPFQDEFGFDWFHYSIIYRGKRVWQAIPKVSEVSEKEWGKKVMSIVNETLKEEKEKKEQKEKRKGWKIIDGSLGKELEVKTGG